MMSEVGRARAELRKARRMERGHAREKAVRAAERALSIAIERRDRRAAALESAGAAGAVGLALGEGRCSEEP